MQPMLLATALLVPLMLMLQAAPVRAQVTTTCTPNEAVRDPLSGVVGWHIETCTTRNRISGAVVRIQTCVVNAGTATSECADQPLVRKP